MVYKTHIAQFHVGLYKISNDSNTSINCEWHDLVFVVKHDSAVVRTSTI